ncbi:MAG TPA: hypothetical protein VII83_06160 [Gaiellaceae bacterium]
MRLKLICAVLVGLLLVIAPGCGSKKKTEATTKATTTAATTTKATTTSSTGGTTIGKTDCVKLAAASKTVGNVIGGKVPSDIATQIASLKALVKAAPAEIKPDFQVLADAASKFAKLGVKPGATMTSAQVTKLMASIDVAKITAASQSISVWAKANCSAG